MAADTLSDSTSENRLNSERGERTGRREALIAVGTGLGVLGIGIGVKANDPELLRMLVTQAPGVAAALLMTLFFLKHIGDDRKYNRHAYKELMDASQGTHGRCHEVTERTMAVIDRNTEMMGKALATLDRVDRRGVLGQRPQNPDNTGE